mmetsp:Transcript_22645/g.48002  ORF Transcript_22645/g.48002 Transcript_22645/m.48002 type:complete len:204 (+) Transcript_22645:404-1015(+)
MQDIKQECTRRGSETISLCSFLFLASLALWCFVLPPACVCVCFVLASGYTNKFLNTPKQRCFGIMPAQTIPPPSQKKWHQKFSEWTISLHLHAFPSKCFMANWCCAVTIFASVCKSFAIPGLPQKKTPTDPPSSWSLLVRWACAMALRNIRFQSGRPAQKKSSCFLSWRTEVRTSMSSPALAIIILIRLCSPWTSSFGFSLVP